MGGADIFGTHRDYKKFECQARELERLKTALGLKIETADFKKLLIGPRDGWKHIKSDVGIFEKRSYEDQKPSMLADLSYPIKPNDKMI